MATALSKVNFSLTQLEYVLAVQRCGHFSEAAKQCHVTQPTLSMQIQKLEEQLGTVIFDRSKKPILLTEKGRALVTQMQAIVFEARKIEAILSQQSGEVLAGSLTVGIIPTVAPYLLPLLLPVMEREYPQVTLKIREMQTHAIVSALSSDEIDLGLLAVPLGIPAIHERVLYTETFSVFCQKNHALAKRKKVSQDALLPDDIWLLEEGHCLRGQILDVCSLSSSADSKRRFQFESGSLETLKRLVQKYGGYTLVPSLATESPGANTVLVPFERPVPARDIGMAYQREHYKGDLLEAVARAVMAAVPETLVHSKRRDLVVIPIGGEKM